MIILATTSTYRIEIFQRLGLKFISEGSNVDEHTGNEPSDPRELTQYLARLKAESVARHHSTGIVI
jgi:predicted house-cleaning NTP pyrophosphatase (Maf/HAM1 superfamily)